MCFFLFSFLIPTASAHPGRTDSNGGHTDYSTGKYHYHHGYDAHMHVDLDDDGVLDCPYDFDDQTDHSARVTSTSDSYSNGKKEGYADGYADGYKTGKSDGKDLGYQDGLSEGQKVAEKEYLEQIKQLNAKHQDEIYNQRHISTLAILSTLGCAIMFSHSRVRKKLKKYRSEEEGRISQLVNSHQEEISQIKATHESKFALATRTHIRVRKEMEAAHEAKIKELTEEHKKKEQAWQSQIKHNRLAALLERISSGNDPDIKLPEGIHFKPSFTVVKGKTSRTYPYGELTVFMNPKSKKYHYQPGCSLSAKPVHFFDVCRTAEPCSKCVPNHMYPQSHPEWYISTREKLDVEASNISSEK